MSGFCSRRSVQFIALTLGLFAIAVGLPRCSVGDEARPGGFRFLDDGGALRAFEGERPVLAYNYAVQKKAGVPDDRARSCYVHPLYGLDGEILTDDFPRDHYHHRGLFWAWPHIRIADNEYDLWMLRGIRHQFERWQEQSADAESGVLACENGWYVGSRRVLSEQVRITIHAAREGRRTIQIALQLSAGDEPVTLWGAAGKSYGGLSLRFAPREETTVTTSEGRQQSDLNLTRLAWADLSGRFSGAAAASGICLFVARDHPDFPPLWITRQYGFLGVGWPGIKPATLRPGQTTTCRYTLLIHRGAADPAGLARTYQQVVERP